MSEPSNESAAPAPAGEPLVESIQWEETPPAQPSAPAQPSQETQPVVPAQPPAEPNPDFTLSALENGEQEMRLATGQVYKGKDINEIATNLAKAQAEASRTITQLRSQQPAPVVPTPVAAPEAIDPATMAIADLLAPAFGAKSGAELVEGYKRMQNQAVQGQSVAQEMQNHQTAVEFLRTTPDFVNTPANSQKLDEVLVSMNLPFTAENARFAHFALKGQGLYETPTVVNDANGVPRTPAGQFAPRQNLMPMPPNASTPSPTAPAQIDPFQLSDADFDKAFRERMSA